MIEPITVFHPKISACRQALVQAREALGSEHPTQWAKKHPFDAFKLAEYGLRAAATETLLHPALDPRLLRLYLDPDSPLEASFPFDCRPLSQGQHPSFTGLATHADGAAESQAAAKDHGLHRLPGLASPEANRTLASIETVAETHPMLALSLVHQHLSRRWFEPGTVWPRLSLSVQTLWQAPSFVATPTAAGWLFSGDLPPLRAPFDSHLTLATTPEGPRWLLIGLEQTVPLGDGDRDPRDALSDVLEESWILFAAAMLGMLRTLLDEPPDQVEPLIRQRWTFLASQREIGRLLLRRVLLEQDGEDRRLRAALTFWHLWRALGQTSWTSQQHRPALGYDAQGPAMRQWSALWHLNAVYGAEEILAARLIAPWLLGAPIRR